MKLSQKKASEAYAIVLDLRNALAAAMRVVYINLLTESFLAETRRAGVKDGIGVRVNEWLKKNKP